MRENIDGPVNHQKVTVNINEMSDAQQVDNTPNMVFYYAMGGWKLWVMIATVVTMVALFTQYVLPELADDPKYKNSVNEIIVAANTAKLAENALTGLPWAELTKAELWARVKNVGTGLHPLFINNPLLKDSFFYMVVGKVNPQPLLMMKRYVGDWEFVAKNLELDLDKIGAYTPAVEVTQSDAASFCSKVGGRLPYYAELVVAWNMAKKKDKHGKIGSLIRPNLEMHLLSQYSLWTADYQKTASWWDSVWYGDNARVFNIDDMKAKRYEDDGYSDSSLSFLCVRELDG